MNFVKFRFSDVEKILDIFQEVLLTYFEENQELVSETSDYSLYLN